MRTTLARASFTNPLIHRCDSYFIVGRHICQIKHELSLTKQFNYLLVTVHYFLQVFSSRQFLVCRANCCDLIRSDSGSTEKVLKSLFRTARMHLTEGPTLLLLEEIGKYVMMIYAFVEVHTHTLFRRNANPSSVVLSLYCDIFGRNIEFRMCKMSWPGPRNDVQK